MCKYPEVIDFDSVEDLCEEITSNVVDEKEYTTCTIVADCKLVVELIHKLLAIKDSFYIKLVSINTVDYDGSYYLTITSECEVYCSQVINDGIPFYNESDFTYIQEDTPESLVDYFGNGFKLIFGINK